MEKRRTMAGVISEQYVDQPIAILCGIGIAVLYARPALITLRSQMSEPSRLLALPLTTDPILKIPFLPT